MRPQNGVDAAHPSRRGDRLNERDQGLAGITHDAPPGVASFIGGSAIVASAASVSQPRSVTFTRT